MSSVLRVVLADRQPVVRRGLLALLEGVGSVDVVADAETSEAAMRALEVHRPDVVLADLSELPGIRATDGTALIAFTSREDDESVRAAIRAGARGYIFKTAEQDDIVRAIHAVAAGEVVFGKPIAAKLVAVLLDVPDQRFRGLTDRQREVASLAAIGLGNAAIAQRLGLTAKTVRNHLSQILLTLGLSSRSALGEVPGRLARDQQQVRSSGEAADLLPDCQA